MKNIFIGFVLGLVVASQWAFRALLELLTEASKPSKNKAKNWPSKSGKPNLDCAKSG
jgi:hypothetical protein